MKALCIIGGTLLALAAPTHADVIFDNFGPGDTYSLDMGWTLSYGGPLGGDHWEQAAPFTVTGGDHYLDMIEIAILHNWGPDLIYADIRADDNGAPGDTILETTTGSGMTPPFVWSPPMQLQFSGNLVLEDGQQYWLALRPEMTDVLISWAFNETDDFGLRAWRFNLGPWETAYGDPGTDSERGVYRVHATPVPAPSSLALVGVAALCACRRRG